MMEGVTWSTQGAGAGSRYTSVVNGHRLIIKTVFAVGDEAVTWSGSIDGRTEVAATDELLHCQRRLVMKALETPEP
jgi:hypothetical protein